MDKLREGLRELLREELRSILREELRELLREELRELLREELRDKNLKNEENEELENEELENEENVENVEKYSDEELEKYLNDKKFMELFNQLPENFIIPLNEIFYISYRTYKNKEIYYDIKYENLYIISEYLENDFEKKVINNEKLKPINIIVVSSENYWIDIFNSGIKIVHGTKTESKPIMTNNYELSELEEKYESIICFTIDGYKKIEEINDNTFKYYMSLDSDFTDYMEEYFTIDFNEYNFESYEKDPDTCSTTMYMCWN
jgi:hypothetical protein